MLLSDYSYDSQVLYMYGAVGTTGFYVLVCRPVVQGQQNNLTVYLYVCLDLSINIYILN